MENNNTSGSLNTLLTKLNSETATITWRELERFFAAGRLLLLTQGNDLIHCAANISLDASEQIKPLLDSKELQWMPVEFVKQTCQPDTLFWSVVIAPYIVVQLKH